MKILAATTTFKPDLHEAISKNIVHLYEAVSPKADVTLLIPGALPPGYPSDAPFRIESYSSYNPYGSGKALLLNIRRLMMKIEEMNPGDYDLIHLHVGFCLEYVLLRRVARTVSVPVMVTVWQPYVSAGEVASFFRPGRWRLVRDMLPHILLNSFLLRTLYARGADVYRRILVSSRVQREQLARSVSGDRIEQMINGVKEAGKTDHDQNTGANRLLYIGHYTPAKGVDMILKALALLKGRLSFTMTFAFSDRGNLKHFWRLVQKYGLQEYITVKGAVSVEEEMSRHDLFLIPYHASVGVSYYPNVVLECISAGLPLLSTRIPVMRELLDPVDTRLLVPMNDAPALAGRIGEFFNEPERLKAVRQSFLEQRDRYHLDAWVERYQGVCRQVLDDARR